MHDFTSVKVAATLICILVFNTKIIIWKAVMVLFKYKNLMQLGDFYSMYIQEDFTSKIV